MVTKEKAISEYNRIKRELGHQPSQTQFLKMSCVKMNDLFKIYGGNAYAQLTEDAGDKPQLFRRFCQRKITGNSYLQSLLI